MAEIAAKAAEGNEGPRIYSGQSYRPANRTDQRVLKCLLNIGQHVGKSGSPTMVCFRNLSLRDKDQLKDRWVCTQGGFAGGSMAGHWNAWYADQSSVDPEGVEKEGVPPPIGGECIVKLSSTAEQLISLISRANPNPN